MTNSRLFSIMDSACFVQKWLLLTMFMLRNSSRIKYETIEMTDFTYCEERDNILG